MSEPSTLMARRAAVEPIEVVVRTAAAAAVPPEAAATGPAAVAPTVPSAATATAVSPAAVEASPVVSFVRTLNHKTE